MQELLHFALPEPHPLFKEDGKNLSPETYQQLRQRWPQFFPPGKTCFEVEFEGSSPVLREIIGFLRKTGREPYIRKFPALANVPTLWTSHYQVYGKRIFDASDLEAAEFFYMGPMHFMGGSAQRGEDGLLVVTKKDLYRVKIGGLSTALACQEEIKAGLEAMAFFGLKFLPVHIDPPKRTSASVWEMTSEITMPPVLNRLINQDGGDFDSSTDKGCWPDDFYFPQLLHFPAAAVRALGDFDFALTSDQLGIPRHHYVIASRRVRDWCMKKKLKLAWDPVILDESSEGAPRCVKPPQL